MIDFNGKVALVTGAGRGIGRAYAMLLAARGCRVVVNDLPDKGEAGPVHEVVREIAAAGGMAVANEDSVLGGAKDIVRAAIESYGRLDILINNAGSFDPGLFETFPAERWPAQVDIHLFAAVDLCRAAWPHLKQSGSGKIVNTLSSAIYGNPQITNYAAAKSALMGFSRALAHEAAALNIDVNCVCPSASTRMQANVDASLQPFLKANFKTERVAAFVAWLVHEDTRIRSEIFEIGGGVAARVRLAHQPFIRADADTPEAWKAQEAALVADAPLIPVASTMEMGLHQFQAVDPEFTSGLSNILTEP